MPLRYRLLGIGLTAVWLTRVSRPMASLTALAQSPNFQTFYFGPEFSGLTRVEIPSYGWSLDNLYVSVPEPGTFALMILGMGTVVVLRFKRGRHEARVSSPPR
jgi:hypothetical protein